MSVEFSGQITRSGAGRKPARTWAANAIVAAAWFLVTVVARSCLGRFRACGTLPWTAATTAVGPGPGVQRQIRLPASAPATAATVATAARARGWRKRARRLPTLVAARGRDQPSSVITRYARQAPASATTNVSSGGPPIAAQPAVGAAAWLIARRPHGTPP